MTVFRFVTSLAVRYGDIDAQGHLNHAKYFTYMEQARMGYFAAAGMWQPAQGFDALGQIVAEAACVYKRPVHLGDTVEVAVRMARLGNKSMEMEYRLTAAGAEVATGRTVQVAYDYALQKSIPVPPEWRDKITAFEGHTP